jgi:diguanylate cyclase (GGDEF)-like protein
MMMPGPYDTAEKTAVLKLDELDRSLITGEEAPYLIVIAGRQVGKQYKLTEAEMVIGRADDCQVRLEDDGVSRKHARVVHKGGAHVLEDMGSTNGTFANGAKVEGHTLRDGDKIQIGSSTVLKFTVQDSLEENAQRSLYDSATRDGLTGAYNKKSFAERLRTEFSFAQRRAGELSLVLFDIDHFKRVNDTHGHLAGDHVLRELAAVVTRQLRTEDMFARYGGEEFGLILRETEVEKAHAIAERIRRAVQAHPFVHEGTRIPVTISLGVAALDVARHRDAKALVAAADELLYAAKHAGRNRTMSTLVGG